MSKTVEYLMKKYSINYDQSGGTMNSTIAKSKFKEILDNTNKLLDLKIDYSNLREKNISFRRYFNDL
jgi:hypothetical protein